MKRCGLIGSPVQHSLSAVMQSAAFDAMSIEASYELWETAAEHVSTRVETLRDRTYFGANVTVPHKQRVMAHCDERTQIADRIGAVNTIINRGGVLVGDNTDAYGFEQVVRTSGITDGSGLTAMVLGAGGASRAVIVALQEMGFGQILIFNRSGERARTLVAELGTSGSVRHVDVEERDGMLVDVDVLVNATSLGWHADETPLPITSLRSLPDGALVVDLTYRDTLLLQQSRELGLGAVDGLMMLVHQGARAFSLWTGLDAPVETMRRAVVAEQAARA